MDETLSPQRRADRVFSGLLPEFYDRITITYPTATTEEYTYTAYNQNSGNNQIMAVIQVTYTDNTKVNISMVARLI